MMEEGLHAFWIVLNENFLEQLQRAVVGVENMILKNLLKELKGRDFNLKFMLGFSY